ncbi:MAG: Gfo/Idh/MocA family oxidoreductase, partial [Bacteroidota bacterium]
MFKPLRYGMVGGGPGAFIGDVHRRAARLDGLTTLVAGVFSSTAQKSKDFGATLGLHPDRVYGSYEEMAEREAALPDSERIDFVSIVTPNHLHHPVAKAFIERGFHV